MAEQDNRIGNDGVSRRSFLGKTSAALAAAASLPILAAAQQTKDMNGDSHIGANEQEFGPQNPGSGGAGPGFGVSAGDRCGWSASVQIPVCNVAQGIESGGWTRQVTVRDFPLSKRWLAWRCV